MKIAALFISILMVGACAGKNGPGQDAARDALGKLQKIQAATQVGVNQINYGPLLIEAKSAINEANRHLSEGQLKSELNSAIDAYADAASAWQSTDEQIETDSGKGLSWKAKYSIPEQKRDYGDRKPYFTKDTAVQIMWMAADVHINNAAKALQDLSK
jgi:hypothetical protein